MQTNAEFVAGIINRNLKGATIIKAQVVSACGVSIPVLKVRLADGNEAWMHITSDPEGNDGGWVSLIDPCGGVFK